MSSHIYFWPRYYPDNFPIAFLSLFIYLGVYSLSMHILLHKFPKIPVSVVHLIELNNVLMTDAS
jgi:hypothetical protein